MNTKNLLLAACIAALPAVAHAQPVTTVVGIPFEDVSGFGGCGQFHIGMYHFAVNTSSLEGNAMWTTVTSFARLGEPMAVNYNTATILCNPLAPSGGVVVVQALGVGNPSAF